MELTDEQIADINSKSPMDPQSNEQGVFNEPSGIPNDVKGLVVYMRWEEGGVSGGSCWDSSNPQHYVSSDGEPRFDVLDLVLKELAPNLTYLDYRGIETMIRSNQESEYEYYGNRTDFGVKFIPLSDVIEYLTKNKLITQ